jgi:hypothetical protein
VKAVTRVVLIALLEGHIDPYDYVPVDPLDDSVSVQFLLGPDDGPGEESFQVSVCTPRWLSREIAAKGPLDGRHHLIVEPFDLGAAVDYLRGLFESLEGETWDELGEKCSRIGLWEFEDYRP